MFARAENNCVEFFPTFSRNNRSFEMAQWVAVLCFVCNANFKQIFVNGIIESNSTMAATATAAAAVQRHTELTLHQQRIAVSVWRWRKWYLQIQTTQATVCLSLSKHMIMRISCLYLPPTVTGNLITRQWHYAYTPTLPNRPKFFKEK